MKNNIRSAIQNRSSIERQFHPRRIIYSRSLRRIRCLVDGDQRSALIRKFAPKSPRWKHLMPSLCTKRGSPFERNRKRKRGGFFNASKFPRFRFEGETNWSNLSPFARPMYRLGLVRGKIEKRDSIPTIVHRNLNCSKFEMISYTKRFALTLPRVSSVFRVLAFRNHELTAVVTRIKSRY